MTVCFVFSTKQQTLRLWGLVLGNLVNLFQAKLKGKRLTLPVLVVVLGGMTTAGQEKQISNLNLQFPVSALRLLLLLPAFCSCRYYERT